MSKHTCEDGTKVYIDWSEGGSIHIECACGNDELWLNGNPMSSGETEVNCACGKRYSSSPYVSCDFRINDRLEVTF